MSESDSAYTVHWQIGTVHLENRIASSQSVFQSILKFEMYFLLLDSSRQMLFSQ